ncbi:MAG: DUF1998 domain-containing protein [Lentimicrobiaceae bacterium]|nr:DUF1998 domain-containing protein [Lentimicrobiaceae bacterium]
MEISSEKQYNQSIGKFKVLSSNAGVGSIITTKSGFFVMPLSVSEWAYIDKVNKQLRNDNTKTPEMIANEAGVDTINDPRFVDFLKREQRVENLKVLVEVIDVALSDYNTFDHEKHLLYKRTKESTGHDLKPEHFIIPAVHFPRWFYSREKKIFKHIDDWIVDWKNISRDKNLYLFAPPRDPYTKRTYKDKDIYDTLVQIPMLLICKQGHISDIPWYELFCAGLDNGGKLNALSVDHGVDLFNYECKKCPNGGRHELQWIENRNSSESWGILKCKKCNEVVSLEGIMNIKPLCPAETPWNGLGSSENKCIDVLGNKGVMQMALATSNSIYYADSFSSLYLPTGYSEDISTMSRDIQEVFKLLSEKWYYKALDKNPELSKEDFCRQTDIADKADDSGFNITDKEVKAIINAFLNQEETAATGDSHEQYRYEEFKVFSNHSESLTDSNSLEFKDVVIDGRLKPYFKKIQQVETLSVTLTQLGFNRVMIPIPIRRDDGIIVYPEGQHIYREPAGDVYALPANRSLGEGLFFELDRNKVRVWVQSLGENAQRYNRPEYELGKSLKQKMDMYGAPEFYLLHTFAHIIIKELEFSCGYPSASLQERLYYSDRMLGVLIYTTDGAEGSMGGLVWQGQSALISNIIKSALQRATDCSSDPLCWENEGQLNLASCFSCSMVSETSCEQRNLGLDRRALVDDTFGYFRDLL